MDRSDHKKCLNTALRLLTLRDHSCRELEGKLKQRGYQRKEIDTVVSECRRLSYLDDRRFAFSQIRYLRNKGYGPHRIQQILKNKGLAADLIGEALDAKCTESDQIHDCHDVLDKKLRQSVPMEDISKQRARLYRFLFQRGFPAAVIRRVMDEKPISAD